VRGATLAGEQDLTWADVPRATIWAALWDSLEGQARRGASRPLSVVDAGGGSGGFAVPLAMAGHRVLVIDPNVDSLAALARRAAEGGVAERVDGRQADLADLPTLVEPGSVDLLLCHDVLEYVESPSAALAAAIPTLRAGGLLSLVVANRHAPVLARALAGRFAEAEHALTDPDGRSGPADRVRRFDPAELVTLVGAGGAEVIATHGARIFTDILPGVVRADAGPGGPAALARLEQAVADQPPFRDIAAAVHVLARRRPSQDGGPDRPAAADTDTEAEAGSGAR
jgi:2-polyprenyl-3-methyl-5-hydroxy-6-metoxy-1,4-benzoquinol methylase